MPTRNTIAKIGHISRELSLKKPLSEKSYQRLEKIIETQKEGFSAPDELEKALAILKFGKTIDDIDEQMQFWIREFLEWANAGIIEIEFGKEE